MPKFRSKPVEIDAIKAEDALKYASSGWSNLPKWLTDEYEKGNVLFGSKFVGIQIADGSGLKASPGDWIVHGDLGIHVAPQSVIDERYDPIA